MKKSIIPFVNHSTESWIKLGLGGLWGNKGATMCQLKIGETNISFINAHLSAHRKNENKRKSVSTCSFFIHFFKLQIVYYRNSNSQKFINFIKN